MLNTKSKTAPAKATVPAAIDMLHRTNGLVELMFLASEHLDDSHMANAFTTSCHLIEGMLEDTIAVLHAVHNGDAK